MLILKFYYVHTHVCNFSSQLDAMCVIRFICLYAVTLRKKSSILWKMRMSGHFVGNSFLTFIFDGNKLLKISIIISKIIYLADVDGLDLLVIQVDHL